MINFESEYASELCAGNVQQWTQENQFGHCRRLVVFSVQAQKIQSALLPIQTLLVNWMTARVHLEWCSFLMAQQLCGGLRPLKQWYAVVKMQNLCL